MHQEIQGLAFLAGEGLLEKRPARRPIPGMAELAAMWPGGRRAFLTDLGDMEVRPRDFGAWADGRGELSHAAIQAINVRANVRPGPDLRDQAGGGYLLVASKARQLCHLYDALTDKGGVSVSREVVSPEGRPSGWRFLLFQRAGSRACIALVQPGSPAGDMLNRRHLMNFGGAAVATPAVWNSVQFIVRHHEDLRAPGMVGADFEAMHGGWMATLQRASGQGQH